MLSVRGAQGGYRLARPDTEITAGEILRAVEGRADGLSPAWHPALSAPAGASATRWIFGAG